MRHPHSNVTCCLPNWTQCDDNGQCLDQYTRGVFIAIGIVELVSCVQGNCLLLRSLMSRDSMKGSNALYKVYLLNLLCADLGLVGYSLPLLVISLISDPLGASSDVHHKVNDFMFFFCSLASLLILLTVSFIRYLRVCHLRLHKKLFSRRETVLFCILCWGLAFLVALTPVMLNTGCYSSDIWGQFCSRLQNGNVQHFTRIFLANSSLVPALLTGYWNWGIYRHWRDTRFKNRSQYAVIQMEIKRLKQRLKSKRRRRQTSGEESVENAETERSCAPAINENSTGVGGRVSSQTSTLCDRKSRTAPPGLSLYGAGRDTLDESFLQDISYMDQTDDKDCEDNQYNDEETDDRDAAMSSEVMSEEPSCDPGGCSPSFTPAHPSFSGAQSPCSSLATRRQMGSMKGKSIGRARAKRYLRQLNGVGKCKKRKETAFVRSLLVVFLMRAATLSPLGICAALSAELHLPPEVWVAAHVLFFGNFSLNWVVFGVMNPCLRNDYVRCFRCFVTRCRSPLIKKDSRNSAG